MSRALVSRFPHLLIAASIAAALAATPANAALEISLQSGGSVYTQAGGSPLVVVNSIGNFTTTVNTGTSTDAPSLDLSSVAISSTGAGSLIVTLSGNEFTGAGGTPSWLTQFSGNFVTGTATVSLQTFIYGTDTLLGTQKLLSTLTASTTPFSMSDLVAMPTSYLFALTEVLTITTTGPAQLSLDASVSDPPIPEPASLLLLGSGPGGPEDHVPPQARRALNKRAGASRPFPVVFACDLVLAGDQAFYPRAVPRKAETCPCRCRSPKSFAACFMPRSFPMCWTGSA